MDENEIVGTVPTDIWKNMPQLAKLQLSSTNLTGSIPATISSAASLAILSFSDSDLEGDIPSSFGILSGLKQLVLSDIALTGAVYWTVEDLYYLQYLPLTLCLCLQALFLRRCSASKCCDF